MKRILCALLPLIVLLGCAVPAAPETAASAAPTIAPTVAPTPMPTPAPSPTPAPTAAPIPITLYLPGGDVKHLIKAEGSIREDSPAAILDELVRREALPDVDYGRNLYFTVGDSFVKAKGKGRVPRVVARMDVADAFLVALQRMGAEREPVALQCMANTFIEHYGAEVFMLTIEGMKLETDVRDYEKGIAFDQYVKTRGER